MKEFIEAFWFGLGCLFLAVFMYLMLALPGILARQNLRQNECELSRLPSYGEINCAR